MYFLDKSFNWSLKIIIMKVLKLLDIGLQVYIVKFLNKTEKKKLVNEICNKPNSNVMRTRGRCGFEIEIN